jgi:hypothetical protein
MKPILLFCFVFVAGFATAQVQAGLPVDAFNAVKGLKLVTDIDKEDLIGEIRMNWGLSGNIIQLNADMSFSTFSYDCFSKRQIDSGTWSIVYERMLKVSTANGWRLFDIVKVGNWYFFVEPLDRRNFILAFTKFPQGHHRIEYTLNADYFAKENK